MRLHRYWSSSVAGPIVIEVMMYDRYGSRDAGAVGRRRRLIVTKIFVCFSPLNNGSIGHAVRWRWTTNLGRILQFVASLHDKLNGAPLVIAICNVNWFGPIFCPVFCFSSHVNRRTLPCNNLPLCGFYGASSTSCVFFLNWYFSALDANWSN